MKPVGDASKVFGKSAGAPGLDWSSSSWKWWVGDLSHCQKGEILLEDGHLASFEWGKWMKMMINHEKPRDGFWMDFGAVFSEKPKDDGCVYISCMTWFVMVWNSKMWTKCRAVLRYVEWGKWHMKFTTLQAWQASAMGLPSQIAVNFIIGPGRRCKFFNFVTFLSSEKMTLKQTVLRLLCSYVNSWTHHEF